VIYLWLAYALLGDLWYYKQLGRVDEFDQAKAGGEADD
jgi:hypothetical protein